MAISLEKKLEEATVAKKRYQSLFVTVSILFIAVVGYLFNSMILDYAVLENVSITRDDDTNQVSFEYDVVEPGRIDFNYANAILTDRKEAGTDENFTWSWDAQGLTEISIRSRKSVLPHWDKEHFEF
jgi:hypothetical protein